jgi:putative transposase
MTQVVDHLNHSTWECKYHVVFTPSIGRKCCLAISGRNSKTYFTALRFRKVVRFEEGHLMPDHVHMTISIPPKHAVASIIGFMKGKSSIWVAQNIANKKQNFVGHKFWARGYYVSTVGADEKVVRAYIQNQESEDKRLDELGLFDRIR